MSGQKVRTKQESNNSTPNIFSIRLQKPTAARESISEKDGVNSFKTAASFTLPIPGQAEIKLRTRSVPDIRVLIFDSAKDDALPLLLSTSEGFCCSGTYSKAAHLLDKIKLAQPNVILLDVKLPDMWSVTAVKMIRANFPKISILILAAFDDDDIVFNAICAGASGYLLRDQLLENSLESIRGLQEGKMPMSPSVLRRVLKLFHLQNAPPRFNQFDLTDRESDVMNQMIEGASYKIIGASLGICYDTVHSHVKNIYKKLQVNSVSEAVSKALRHRL